MYKTLSVAAFVCLACPLFAQSATNVTLKAGVTSFGGDEGLEYLNLLGAVRVSQDCRLQLGGDFAAQGSLDSGSFSIRHGGSNVEFMAAYAPEKRPYEFGIGLGIPNTPQRSEWLMTYRAAYQALRLGKDRLSVESFGVATPNPIIVFGLRDTYKLGLVSFSAFLGGPIAGYNTVSTNTGSQIKSSLYSIGVDYTFSRNELASVGIAITNQLGWTTGMAATASLGGTPGIEAGVKVRF